MNGSPNVYEVGDAPTIETVFIDKDPRSPTFGEPANPDSVTTSVTKPDGTTLSPAATQYVHPIDGPVEGVFRSKVVITNVPGNWEYRMVGTGANAGTAQGVFRVKAVNT